MQIMQLIMHMQSLHRYHLSHVWIDDCIKRGMSAQEGGAFITLPVRRALVSANVADSLYTIKKHVFEEKQHYHGRVKESS